VATVFIANVYQIDLGVTQYITIVGMSILASIGTAGVPGVGLIMLAMVFNQVGLPVEGIGLILGVDRLLDMMRTVVNITGDATVATPCIIAVPSIFMVAPNGTVKAAVVLLTPMRFSNACRVTGMVALELAVLKEKKCAGRIFLKNVSGLSLAKTLIDSADDRLFFGGYSLLITTCYWYIFLTY
jgi:hypothetical protein